MGTSVLSGSPLPCPQRKVQKDTKVQILKLPLCTVAAGPETLFPQASPSARWNPMWYSMIPESCWARPAEKPLPINTLILGSPSSKHFHLSADVEVPEHERPGHIRIFAHPWSRVVLVPPFPQNLRAHSFLATLRTRAHDPEDARPFFASTFQAHPGNRPGSGRFAFGSGRFAFGSVGV